MNGNLGVIQQDNAIANRQLASTSSWKRKGTLHNETKTMKYDNEMKTKIHSPQ